MNCPFKNFAERIMRHPGRIVKVFSETSAEMDLVFSYKNQEIDERFEALNNGVFAISSRHCMFVCHVDDLPEFLQNRLKQCVPVRDHALMGETLRLTMLKL